MAKLEILADDAKQQISDLKLYRSGWANDIREGWAFGDQEAKKILFDLYEISGSVILALEQVVSGHYRDKMAMIFAREIYSVTAIITAGFKEWGIQEVLSGDI